MRRHRATWVAQMASGQLLGTADTEIGPDVVIDSRKVTPGALFIAFKGDKVDGHDYAGAAVEAGAAAVMGQHDCGVDVPQIIVENPQDGLAKLARQVVAEAKLGGLKVVGVTGSSGKTSTKDILAQLLEADGETVAPIGSFNNELGAPLTAAQVSAATKYLVAEMGARAIGDVAWLCSITKPDVSIVLNIGTAHIGEFGSQENIAKAKGEIVEALDVDGWAILNADDPLVAAMTSRCPGHIGWFGTDLDSIPEGAELAVVASNITLDALERPSFELSVHRPGEYGQEVFSVSLKLVGHHMAIDAAAAAAAAIAAGVIPETVAQTLGTATSRSPMRMELEELPSGTVILNDAYNANPDSMKAALTTLGAIGRSRKQTNPASRTVAILGDMLELGPESAKYHHEVGRQVAAEGVDVLVAVGQFASEILDGARAQLASSTPRHAMKLIESETVRSVADMVEPQPEDVWLIKASRGMALEQVVEKLQKATPRVGGDSRPLSEAESSLNGGQL